MAETTKAAVVHAFGKPLRIEQVPPAGQAAHQDGGEQGLQCEPSCCGRRLAGRRDGPAAKQVSDADLRPGPEPYHDLRFDRRHRKAKELAAEAP